jgi:glutamyl-tRNA reductase
MDLFGLSISHRTAPLEIREKLWFSDEEARAGVHELKKRFFGECMLFSTCNRTEVYGVNPHSQVSGGEVRRFLIGLKNASGPVNHEHFVSALAEDAVEHLFRVSGGIESMVIGDIQILNQVKVGFKLAMEEHTLGPVLNRLMQASLHVGKRARSETTICEGAVSVSYAAVELANKIFNDLSSKSVLLIGAGKTGELTIKHLISRGIGRIKIANRTRSKGEALVANLGGEVTDFDRLSEALARVDIAIASIKSTEPVIRQEDVQRVMKMRQKRPLFLIDLGVPRNIQPEIRRMDNVFLYDLDSLGTVVDRNVDRRKEEIPAIEKIVSEEKVAFVSWYNSLQVGPTIHELRETIESIRLQEVEKNINRFRQEDRELVDLVTKRIVNKILHHPITALKQHSENGAPKGEALARIHALREMFRLGDRNGGNEE